MPYESGRGGYELAKRLGHVPIVDNDLVKEELQDLETREPELDTLPLEEHTIHRSELENQKTGPLDYIFSFDGSRDEVEVKEDFPANRIGFVQTSAVLTHLRRIEEQEGTRLVDPARVKQIADTDLLQAVVPSTNFRRKGDESTHESFRRSLWDKVFTGREIEGQSLQSWFETIVSLTDHEENGELTLRYCPIDNDCDGEHIQVPVDAPGECSECGGKIYPTDWFRIHERVNDQQRNETAITNMMNLMEHLSCAIYLRYISEHSQSRLEKVGFILDGPLAQFDTGARFFRPLLENIRDIYEGQWIQAKSAPPIVGIEKSGQFVAHAKYIQDEIPPETILWMDDEYIYNHIIVSRNTDTYGAKTYYGQKFIYKARSGRIFVLNIPKVPLKGKEKHSPHAYPQFERTIRIVEEVQTALYEDSLIPVALANEYASIPLKTGSKVLELLSRGETDFSRQADSSPN